MNIRFKRRIQTGIALLCSLAITTSVLPVSADNEISDLENQSSSLQNELQGINQDILKLSEQISGTEMKLEVLNSDIDRNSDELAEAEKNEEKQYEDMKARIKYMYEHGNATLLEMLFSAENMSDFLNKADFIENLSSYDRKALNNLKEVHQDIQERQDELAAQKASLSELQGDLTSQQAELQEKAAQTSTNLTDVQNRLEQAKEEEARRIAQEEAERKKKEQEAAAEAAAKAAEAQKAASSSQSSSNSSGSSSGGGNNGSVSNQGSTNVSANDVTLLAAIIECEANQNYDSLLAVATVIMNRVQSSRFPNTIKGVIYASGQFAPVWTGSLNTVLNRGPRKLSMQVAQDAINGARLGSVSDCYYFLYAPSTNRKGVVVGDNVFFQSW